jgi:two-component system, chemotaxis family, sensor kinase CheA
MELDFKALQQSFLIESEEHLCELEEGLIALETRPNDEDILQKIFRNAHTVKGAASCISLSTVTEFAHVLEDTLERLRDFVIPVSSDLITLLLHAVDALRQLIVEAIAGAEEMQPAHKALLRRLARRVHAASNNEGAIDRAEELAQIETILPAFQTRTLRVDIDKLDRMLNLTGEITIARGQLRQRVEALSKQQRDSVAEAFEEADRFMLELQELVMQIRMVPVGPIFRQHVRTVRDLARAHHKNARLIIEGAEVEVDTSVVEHLKDPLAHMIRNAIDHGIEEPQAREAAGKDPCGSLRVCAYHDGGSIVIELSDDGAGLNRGRIIERAVTRGMIADPEKLSDQEIRNLIFEPGFTTAAAVTDLSGRGVGMDVVRRNIEALRGSVAIESIEGRGTTVKMRLPLTLAIIEGLSVGVGRESYVIPLDSVLECIELPDDERSRGRTAGIVSLRGEPLPYVRIRDVFNVGGEDGLKENLVVVKYESGLAGLAVDELHGESEVVIKPLGRLFAGLTGIAGSTILGNGRVALILDVPGLMREVLAQQSNELIKQARGENELQQR